MAVSFNVLADCTTTPEVELEPPVADEEKPCDGERGVAGGFRFKCTDAKGAEATLAFELREPVIDAKCYAVLNPSRTKTKRVRCDLVKEEPHFFDRLTAGEKELKGVASVDYDRWVEAPDDEAADRRALAAATAETGLHVLPHIGMWTKLRPGLAAFLAAAAERYACRSASLPRASSSSTTASASAACRGAPSGESRWSAMRSTARSGS